MGVALIALVVALERHDLCRRAHRHEADQGQRDHEREDPQRRGQEHRPRAQQRRHRQDRRERRHGPADQGRQRRQRRSRQRLRDRRKDPRRRGRQQRPRKRCRHEREDPRRRVGNSDLADDAVTAAARSPHGTDCRCAIAGHQGRRGRRRQRPRARDGGHAARRRGSDRAAERPGLGALRASCAAGDDDHAVAEHAARRPWPSSTRSSSHGATAGVANDATSVGRGGASTQPANSGAGGMESVMWQASVDDSWRRPGRHDVGDGERQRRQLPHQRAGHLDRLSSFGSAR